MAIVLDAEPLAAYQGDTLGEPVELPVESTEVLDWVTGATGVLEFSDGTSAAVAAVWDGATDPATVSVTLPALTVAGLAAVVVTLTGATGSRRSGPWFIVVQDPESQWLSLDAARQLWEDGPADDRELFLTLESARSACEEFAPELQDGERVPNTYRHAQLVQARNTWEATVSGGSDSLGDGEFTVPRHPLDWHVRQLLRPRQGFPAVT